MSKSVLVTGANGFVGRHLLEKAKAEGYQPIAAVRQKSNVDTIESLNVPIIRLDYSSGEKLLKSLKEYGPFEYVVHNAGVTEAIDLESYRQGNVVVTANLIEALGEGDLLKKNFVYVSSLAARGPDFRGQDNPISDYGKSKFEAEKVVKSSGLPSVIIRPTAVYGSGDRAFLALVKLMQKHISLTIGSKQQKLTFIHGSDLAKLIFNVLYKVGECHYGHDGKVYRQSDLVKTIADSIGVNFLLPIHIPTSIVKTISYAVNWVYNNVFNKSWHYNPAKIRELTATDWTIAEEDLQKSINFTPDFKLDQGFEEAVSFYRENGWC